MSVPRGSPRALADGGPRSPAHFRLVPDQWAGGLWMPVFVKIEYQDDLAVVKSGVRAESKNAKLTVFDAQGVPVASFAESRVLHWWIGDLQEDQSKGKADESF